MFGYRIEKYVRNHSRLVGVPLLEGMKRLLKPHQYQILSLET